MISGPGQDVGKLQSNEYEHQSVEDECQRIPNRIRLQSHVRREKVGTPAAEVKSARHDRQHSGSSKRIGGEIGAVRGQETEGDLYRTVVDAAFYPVDDRSDQQSHRDAAYRQ